MTAWKDASASLATSGTRTGLASARNSVLVPTNQSARRTKSFYPAAPPARALARTPNPSCAASPAAWAASASPVSCVTSPGTSASPSTSAPLRNASIKTRCTTSATDPASLPAATLSLYAPRSALVAASVPLAC